MKTFGEFIKIKREKLGIPQRKIAAQLDIDTSTLSKIERNERRATSSMLNIISTELNIELETVEFEFLKDSIHSEFNDLKFLKKNLTKIISEL
jgi:transcriptional regulator with XRE-family HTH domain